MLHCCKHIYIWKDPYACTSFSLPFFWCRKEIINFLKKSRGHETIVSNGNNQLRFNLSRKLCWKTRRKSKLSILLSIKLFTVPQCSSKTSLWWGNFTKQLWQTLRVLKSRYFFLFKEIKNVRTLKNVQLKMIGIFWQMFFALYIGVFPLFFSIGKMVKCVKSNFRKRESR